MKIIAITMAGGGRAHLIGDSIRSAVPIVDHFLLLRTDDSADEAIEVARSIAGDDRCTVRPCPVPHDCGRSRTIALQTAYEVARALWLDDLDLWAMVLDTDERIVSHGEDLRALVARTDKRVVCTLREETQADAKERFIRLPAQGHYHGRAHEYYTDMSSREWARRATFSEISHPREEQDRANEMVRRVMREQIAEEPNCSRWWYFLGDACWRSEDWLGAIEAWQECETKEGPADQRAWACVRAAAACARMGLHEACLRRCTDALTIHAGMAEACWLASEACRNMGQVQQAIYWAHYAIMAGRFIGFGGGVETRTYALTRALYEAPFEALAKALEAAGNASAAAQARADGERAKAARMALAA
jgi:hypothetical protein